MNDPQKGLTIEGIRFFGEMCASISHEIKNVLAIINENNGLLQDMLQMNDEGMPLNTQRLTRLAQSISRQVTRGDEIVKSMNRFAHSADEATETVDTGELIQFMTYLTARLICMRGRTLRIEAPAEPVWVTTNRYLLEYLVWYCLSRALDACREEASITIRTERTDNQTRIRFCGLDGSALEEIVGFPSARESAMASLIDARLTVDRKMGEIGIALP